MKQGWKQRQPHGFTLIETLVVIAVIAILAAITISMLARTRMSARESQSLSNIRQNVVVFAAYTTDHQDYFPQLFPASLSRNSISCGPYRINDLGYFETTKTWNIGLASRYYDGNVLSEVFFSPFIEGFPVSAVVLTSYHHTQTILAAPEYWNRTTRLTGITQWRAVRASEVRIPSSKGLFLDYVAYGTKWGFSSTVVRRLPVGFCDGSARAIERNDFRPPCDLASGGPPGDDSTGPLPVIHTLDGVYGADVN